MDWDLKDDISDEDLADFTAYGKFILIIKYFNDLFKIGQFAIIAILF